MYRAYSSTTVVYPTDDTVNDTIALALRVVSPRHCKTPLASLLSAWERRKMLQVRLFLCENEYDTAYGVEHTTTGSHGQY